MAFSNKSENMLHPSAHWTAGSYGLEHVTAALGLGSLIRKMGITPPNLYALGALERLK